MDKSTTMAIVNEEQKLASPGLNSNESHNYHLTKNGENIRHKFLSQELQLSGVCNSFS